MLRSRELKSSLTPFSFLFLSIRDLREIDDEDLRDRMREAEELARREKRGLWSSDP